MASAVNFCLALFILAGFVHVDADLKRYVSLISNVRKYYETSSVLFVYSRNDRRLEEYTLAHSLCRDFSRRHVYTLIVNFEELNERINWFRRQICRPLIVILLDTVSDIEEFSENTESMDISYPIWLVIFTNEFTKDLCEYCEYPKGNMFRLRFDTEMLVLCCENPMLQEWWAIDDNRTETSDFITWTKDKELQFFGLGGFYTRRHDVKGTGLRVGIVVNSPLVREDGDRIEGFFGDILMELKRAMNFTISKIIRDQGFGTWNSKVKRWTGLVGRVVQGEADLGVADFTITSSRHVVVDYTLPLTVSRSRLYIREPDGLGVQWSAYFQAFTVTIWMAIIILIITSTILLSMIKKHEGSMSLLSLVVENYLHVWGIFCQQGLCEFPIGTPLRIAYFSIFVSALVVSAAYAASLVSFLTISSSGMPFTTLEGFVKDRTYELMVYQNHSDYDLIATSSDPVFQNMMAFMRPLADLPETLSTGWEQVCKQRVALYTNDVTKKTSNIDIKCKVAGIDAGRTDHLAMIMPNGSQYTKVINYHIQRFQDMGILHRLRNKYFTKSPVVKPKFNVVNLWGVAPVLATLTGGIIVALVILFGEKMYYSLKNHLHSRSHLVNSRQSNSMSIWRYPHFGIQSRTRRCPTLVPNKPSRDSAFQRVQSHRSVNVAEKERTSLQNLRSTVLWRHGKFSNSLARICDVNMQIYKSESHD